VAPSIVQEQINMTINTAHQEVTLSGLSGVTRISLHGNPEVGYEVVYYSTHDAVGHQVGHYETADDALSAFKILRIVCEAFDQIEREEVVHAV
jgi:hypothetical protein